MGSTSRTELEVETTLGIDDIVVVPVPEARSTEACPVVVPPYPVEPRHPTTLAMPPGPNYGTHNPPYPTHTPHLIPGAAPYPFAGPSRDRPVSDGAPYPPVGPPVGGTAPFPDSGADPPSYSQAVSQPPAKPGWLFQTQDNLDGYSKQAPYNPTY